MKLKMIAEYGRNSSAVSRFPSGQPAPTEIEVEDNTDPLKLDPTESGDEEAIGDGVPDDMGNRLPSGGAPDNTRKSNIKVRRLQGDKIPPIY